MRFFATTTELDERLAGHEFVCGKRFSISDITAFCALYFASLVEVGIPNRLRDLERWHDAVASRPSATA